MVFCAIIIFLLSIFSLVWHSIVFSAPFFPFVSEQLAVIFIGLEKVSSKLISSSKSDNNIP